VPGRLTVAEASVDLSQLEPALTGPDARAARIASLRLGRVAAAYEMLGAAEGAEAQALTHAAGREQFGQPIGAFQAVRHLLAWARTDLVAVESMVGTAIDLEDQAPLRFDEMVKAIAGRNCRRSCERTLQVLGAIGFTAEQGHHHFHGRVLLLDALLGSSADLTVELGAWLRELGTDPQVPLALLLPGRA
jgi:alkylation response protein AidB-like acyl-CoA dehydrogenase